MYFAGSKKSVRFAESARKLQFCSQGMDSAADALDLEPGQVDEDLASAPSQATTESAITRTRHTFLKKFNQLHQIKKLTDVQAEFVCRKRRRYKEQ